MIAGAELTTSALAYILLHTCCCSRGTLARIRKDRVIQDFEAALRDLGKGGLVLQGGSGGRARSSRATA
jgi:hypothetical protein